MKKVYLSNEQLETQIDLLATKIKAEVDTQNLVCICVLRGAFMFFSDLLKKLNDPQIEVDFIRLKSYEGTQSTGIVQLVHDLVVDIEGKDVMVIEDIVDTGTSLEFMREHLLGKKPKKLLFTTLIYKPHASRNGFKPDYFAFKMEEDPFVVGYGLDLDQKMRCLPYIATLEGAS